MPLETKSIPAPNAVGKLFGGRSRDHVGKKDEHQYWSPPAEGRRNAPEAGLVTGAWTRAWTR